MGVPDGGGVDDAVSVGVLVGGGVWVAVAGGLGVFVGVTVGELVAVAVGVMLGVGVGGRGVLVGVAAAPWTTMSSDGWMFSLLWNRSALELLGDMPKL